MTRPLLATICLSLSILSCGKSFAADTALTTVRVVTPPEHVRRPEQTFLTFPEWYLVFGPAEYAEFLSQGKPPSEFPMYSQIGQFWQSYAAVDREIGKYPFNGGYHAMIMVIGISTTVEYGLKGTYEHTIGRLAEATRSGTPIAEEQFAAKFSQDYVDFIRVDPWYKFDFWGQCKILWVQIPMTGPNMTRKWERRFALTTELLVKEGYAQIIKLGSQSLYEAPKPVTAVILNHAPILNDAYPEFSQLGVPGEDGYVLATVPRYEAFTKYSLWLAGQGIDFSEIAGNRSEVVVSELVPTSWQPTDVRLLFEQPILTQTGRKRIVIAVPVAALAAELRRANSQADTTVVEHVFDF